VSLPPTVGAALALGRGSLSSVSDTAGLDAQLLLSEVTNQSKTWLLAHGEADLDAVHARTYIETLTRCQNGEPLPYVIGWWEFYGRRFELNPSVLIPRPETEHLIEAALEFLSKLDRRGWSLDVGTGSGCVAVTLAAEEENLDVLATDISFRALGMARINALKYGVQERVRLVQADLLEPVVNGFDLICANLPYIPSEDLTQLDVARREPGLALDGGYDGLDYVQRMLKRLPNVLSEGGRLILEIGSGQGTRTQKLVQGHLPDAAVEIRKDYAGHERLIVADRIE
jgi:release factor glutamine methyltransferase